MKSPRPCRACGSDFEITEAALKKRNYTCKKCRSRESRQTYESRKARGLPVSGSKMPRSYFREYEKTYGQKEYVKEGRRQRAKERFNDPVEAMKAKTRSDTRRAISRGVLTRGLCEVCGSKKVQAHHDDYSKPLSVRWLCPVHHAELHAKARGNQ